MKSTFIVAVLAATATVHAYQCPPIPAVKEACAAISVRPLICDNPKVNVKECNVKQCIQSYIDNYAACLCNRDSNNFYQHAVNVDGIIRRCGLAVLKNPYGNPNQYRPGQGTQTFVPSSPAVGPDPTTTGLPIVATETPFPTESNKISGGAIAGIVLGTLAAAALAGLLGWCWRKKRNEHTAIYSHSATEHRGPTRTVVTEKIEPVVVKANSSNVATTTGTNYAAPVVPATSGTTYTTSTQPAPVGHTSTTYNTTTPVNTYSTTTSGYNTQPRTGVMSGAPNAAHGTVNPVGSGVNSLGTGASNLARGTTNMA
ncbi:hypothetical protein BG006_011428 [Podila minutissima]|uniref:Extracellular membrane protein CFEM domain-containing protein n=1 Tax=Podila minutissima TaxID=64525 RepID=A0A9P5VHY0_9FUNG|nr:hypothetical protein BG006_011428 [Podila minutissima]